MDPCARATVQVEADFDTIEQELRASAAKQMDGPSARGKSSGARASSPGN
jgi:hypothetical protein